MMGVGKFSYRGIVPRVALTVYEASWFIYRAFSPPREPIQEDVLPSVGEPTRTIFSPPGGSVESMRWRHGKDASSWQAAETEVKNSQYLQAFQRVQSYQRGNRQRLGEFPNNLRYTGHPEKACSTSGPTSDGRSKPDLIAPGVLLGPEQGLGRLLPDRFRRGKQQFRGAASSGSSGTYDGCGKKKGNPARRRCPAY